VSVGLIQDVGDPLGGGGALGEAGGEFGQVFIGDSMFFR